MIDNQSKEIPFFVEDEPLPQWRRSPWAIAVSSLLFGDVKRMAELLERGEPIPPELGKILAIALRGGKGLTFRLQLIANPKSGGKRSGRWPERNGIRDMTLAAQMYKKIQEGQSYDDAALAVVAEAKPAVGDRTVKAAYKKYRNIARAWLVGLDGWGAETKKWAEELAKGDVEPPQPPIARWMLGGDKGCK